MHRKHSEKKYIQILIIAGLWYPRNFYFLITFLYAFQISTVSINYFAIREKVFLLHSFLCIIFNVHTINGRNGFKYKSNLTCLRIFL